MGSAWVLQRVSLFGGGQGGGGEEGAVLRLQVVGRPRGVVGGEGGAVAHDEVLRGGAGESGAEVSSTLR